VHRIGVRNNLGRAVPLVNLFVGVANTAQPELNRLTPTNARLSKHFEFLAIGRGLSMQLRPIQEKRIANFAAAIHEKQFSDRENPVTSAHRGKVK